MNDVQETPLLNIEQASKYIQLSTATLARMRRDNNGPAFVKLGARVLYRKTDLDDFIESKISQ
jgi:predicted DNA-binding transcriptional regulator AlpA